MIKALRFVMLFTVLTALLPLRSFAQGPGFVSGELYFKRIPPTNYILQ